MAKTKKETLVAEAAAVATEQVVENEIKGTPEVDEVKPTDIIDETKSTDIVDETKSSAETVDEISLFPDKEIVEETAKTEKFEAEASEFFESYPDNYAFHFTSDGLAFFQQGDARNHANGLEDKTVITKIRK